MNPKKHNILIVDDEPNILLAIHFLLEQHGYHLATASTGEEALEKMPIFKPDLILLDVMMPGMSGNEVALQIRQTPGYEMVKIVFLTAKGTQADKLSGYVSGADVYLVKPFDNDELVNLISETLQYG